MKEICKSNALIKASCTLSVAEQRIILTCIAQIDHGSPVTDEVMYSVPIASFVKAIGSDSRSIDKEILEATHQLRKSHVRIELEPSGSGRKARILEAGWVQSMVYDEQEQVISLRFNKDTLPLLNELKKQFNRGGLPDVAWIFSMGEAHQSPMLSLSH